MDEHGMLRALPGVFCAGEMIDWEAPTGGYLLGASFASGRAAASGVREGAPCVSGTWRSRASESAPSCSPAASFTAATERPF